jgi:hypothetical protein
MTHKLEVAITGHYEKMTTWDVGYHTNIFAKYFLSYKGDEIDCSVSKSLHFSSSKIGGRTSRYGHFEIKLNGHLCSVCIGDKPFFSRSTYGKSDAKIIFMAQVGKKNTGALKRRYEELGHRIYPIPLPLFHHCEEITNGTKYEDGEKEYLAQMSFNTKSRMHRKPWLGFARNHEDLFCNQKMKNEYLDFITKNTVWGVSLKGHGHNGKCYKESELMYMGFPMALNFKPYYPFPFRANEDYVLLKRPQDLLKLKDIDPKPFAERSRELGEKYIKQPRYLDLMMKCIEQEKYDPIVIKE